MIIGTAVHHRWPACACSWRALTQPAGGKIGLFWPIMFDLMNTIGFAHVLPVSLALFTKIAPQAIGATVIGLYYLAFFAANKMVGLSAASTRACRRTTFWLIHVASAVVGLVGFAVFKLALGRQKSANAIRAAR